jgi:hypothetical protein
LGVRISALLEEYRFVSSLIPMYREFEFKTLQLAISILAAALALWAALFDEDPALNFFLGVLLGLPLALLLFAMAAIEARIVRASRYIGNAIVPDIRALSGSHEVLNWELDPGRFVTAEWWRPLLSTTAFAIFIAAPGFVGSIIGMVGASRLPEHRGPLLLGASLVIVLLAAGLFSVIRISGSHEARVPGAFREAPSSSG